MSFRTLIRIFVFFGIAMKLPSADHQAILGPIWSIFGPEIKRGGGASCPLTLSCMALRSPYEGLKNEGLTLFISPLFMYKGGLKKGDLPFFFVFQPHLIDVVAKSYSV